MQRSSTNALCVFGNSPTILSVFLPRLGIKPPIPKPDWTIQLLGDPGLPDQCVYDPWRGNRSDPPGLIRRLPEEFKPRRH
jgi:hypothetical protein